MPSKIFFYPYSKASKSVWNLVEEIPNARIIKREGSKYVYKPGSHIVVNWGCYRVSDRLRNCRLLNTPEAVEIATSKLRTFNALSLEGIQIPEYTTDHTAAVAWGIRSRILGRDIDRGSEGSGITVYEAGAELGQHRFYVKYRKKKREFRVHVFKGEVIDVQEKLKRDGGNLAYVRNTANGYVFARQNLNENPCPQVCRDIAIRSVNALGLDFGGVDVGFHPESGATVYEVNTAPGLEGTTVTKYAEALNALSMLR